MSIRLAPLCRLVSVFSVNCKRLLRPSLFTIVHPSSVAAAAVRPWPDTEATALNVLSSVHQQPEPSWQLQLTIGSG